MRLNLGGCGYIQVSCCEVLNIAARIALRDVTVGSKIQGFRNRRDSLVSNGMMVCASQPPVLTNPQARNAQGNITLAVSIRVYTFKRARGLHVPVLSLEELEEKIRTQLS